MCPWERLDWIRVRWTATDESPVQVGKEFLELVDVEIGQHPAIHENGGDAMLAREPFHFFVRCGILSHVDLLERDAVCLQVLFRVEAPAAQLARVKLHLSHGLFSCETEHDTAN